MDELIGVIVDLNAFDDVRVRRKGNIYTITHNEQEIIVEIRPRWVYVNRIAALDGSTAARLLKEAFNGTVDRPIGA